MNSYKIIDTGISNPDICIAMLAYNHGEFISEAIESVLKQQTSYSYKIIIAEDYSTDNTRNIILEYQTKYPDRIKVILQAVNVGAQKNNIVLLSNLQGKYVAALEGDDYWTDPLKLQKQVDFLEANEDYAICFTSYYLQNDIDDTNQTINLANRSVTLTDMIKSNDYCTASVLFDVKNILPIPAWFSEIKFGDWGLYLIALQTSNKKAFCLADVTAAYRIHSAGIHGNLHASNLKLVSAYKMHIDFYRQVKKYLFKQEHSKLIEACILERKKIIAGLLKKEKKYGAALLSCWY